MQKNKGIKKIDITPSTHIEGKPGNLYPKVTNTKYLGANIQLNMTKPSLKKEL
jgi:hypothetical protein